MHLANSFVLLMHWKVHDQLDLHFLFAILADK